MTSYKVKASSKEPDRLDDLGAGDNSPRLRIVGVVDESAVDGPGYRYVVFAQGCPHGCPGCHNPSSHSFDGGFITSVGRIIEVMGKNPILSGLTISGGEPFCQAAGFADLAIGAKARGLHVITYTGYTFEQLMAENTPERIRLLSASDWLIDGRFVKDKKSLLLKFRGSSNQRIIDVRRSLDTNKVRETEV